MLRTQSDWRKQSPHPLALPIVAWITEPAKEETDVLNLFTKFLAPLNTCRDDD
jgi:hypothetical protein